ncbi:hypothetical protein LSH36_27g09084 [Paralvinella palmiformis]|uniref:Nucleoside diphosphate kinase-like domain-containing protein n=1 Tax=Paralvinella palmiformis TaxID=53620 RepID=A0AAD9NG94_9ANNE|nr:hypothetical protein LSH36_27g09084 [Paralvinella palmiformis]
MGPTKVYRTVYENPASIRGMFGLTDTRNCTHGSDSEETAKREIGFFFPEFTTKEWQQVIKTEDHYPTDRNHVD